MEQTLNPARALALQILNKTDSAGQYTNLALDAALKRSELSAPDKALVTILVYGVTERRLTLDYMADALASRPMETLDGTVRNLVRMGLYQLRYLDRIPAHAAINETVALAPRRARGFVNAVLREYTRRAHDLPFPDKQTDLYRYILPARSALQEIDRDFRCRARRGSDGSLWARAAHYPARQYPEKLPRAAGRRALRAGLPRAALRRAGECPDRARFHSLGLTADLLRSGLCAGPRLADLRAGAGRAAR